VLLQLLDHVLVDWVDHVQDFITLLDQSLHEGRLGDGCLVLTSDEEDVILSLLHAGDVLFQ
jgi:hypothetical protein